jgi:hypothetical protein
MVLTVQLSPLDAANFKQHVPSRTHIGNRILNLVSIHADIFYPALHNFLRVSPSDYFPFIFFMSLLFLLL